MLGDRGDVKLIDGDFLLAALRAPVFGDVFECRGIGMIRRDAGRRRIEEQMLGEAALFLGNRGEALDFFGVDDGQIESAFGAVIEKNGIDHFSGGSGQAEGNIGNAQNGFDARDFFLDQADGFDGFDCSADVIFVAGGAGENQRIDDDVFDRDAIFFGEQFAGTLGDGQLALAGEGLGLQFVFINASDHQRGAIGTRERADALEFFLAVFEIDGVDDAFALAISERKLDRRRHRWCQS